MGNPATRIVFDLDGTLVQTRIASWEVFREVQAEFGLGVDTAERFFAFFEGNFFESVRSLVDDPKTADALIARFFERLEADYHPVIVPGMTTVARALASRATLAVLSSNATSVIRRVLVENGLQYCFSDVFGGDVEPDKSAALRRFLDDGAQGVGRRCAAPYDEGALEAAASAGDTVLVTDTVGDVEAAVAAGVRVVGVSWGMHRGDRLREAGAEFVAVWPQELVAYLLPASNGENSSCNTCEIATAVTAGQPAADFTGLFTGHSDGPAVSADAPDAKDASTLAEVRLGRRRAAATLLVNRPQPVDEASTCGCPDSQESNALARGRAFTAVTVNLDEMRGAMRAIIGR